MKVRFGHSYDSVLNDAEVFLIGIKGLERKQTDSIINSLNHMVIDFNITPSHKDELYQAVDICLGLLIPFVDMSPIGNIVKIESKSKNFVYTGSFVDALSMLITIEKSTMRELFSFVKRSYTVSTIRLNIEDLCILYDVDMNDVRNRLLVEKAILLNR